MVERTSLRLELFVRELRPSIEFYVRVLGFEREAERPGGYSPLARARCTGTSSRSAGPERLSSNVGRGA